MDELDQDGRQATTTVNAFELFYSAHLSSDKTKNVDKTKATLNRLDIFPLDLPCSERAGEILSDLAKQGKQIDFRDALIAGILSVNNMTLVTRNKNHFSYIKRLKIEEW